ncbi:MAG: gamma-glutamyltransferase family protein [Epibacterium sp.]|nr:gamma-glutamyltransferase family protein [Epibacterium sp.]NQX75465.1 gamma-glutamyltransferase [Epibacterium sp.]
MRTFNRLKPRKRPRSFKAPTIILESGVRVLALGAPGVRQIMGDVAKSIMAWADWGAN